MWKVTINPKQLDFLIRLSEFMKYWRLSNISEPSKKEEKWWEELWKKKRCLGYAVQNAKTGCFNIQIAWERPAIQSWICTINKNGLNLILYTAYR